jgi:hypothetical protein
VLVNCRVVDDGGKSYSGKIVGAHISFSGVKQIGPVLQVIRRGGEIRHWSRVVGRVLSSPCRARIGGAFTGMDGYKDRGHQ